MAEQPVERNWLPLIIAVVLIAGVVTTGLVMSGRRQPPAILAVTSDADPYAPQLPMTRLQMSESANLSGGKMTYIDGHISNRGDRTIRDITVQVVFRNFAHEVAQNQTVPLTLIRMREPYIDTRSPSPPPRSKPGAEQDPFRLTFDARLKQTGPVKHRKSVSCMSTEPNR